MDLWRPTQDRLTFSDAAWLGAAWGIAMHAILHFFSLWMPALRVPLELFLPAERLAFFVAGGAPPFITWLTLLASEGIFWALAAVAALAAFRWLEQAARGETPRASAR